MGFFCIAHLLDDLQSNQCRLKTLFKNRSPQV